MESTRHISSGTVNRSSGQCPYCGGKTQKTEWKRLERCVAPSCHFGK